MPQKKFTVNKHGALKGLHNASKHLFNKGSENLETNSLSDRDFGFIHGGIILQALSIELKLKTIIKNSGTDYERIHDIKLLFKQLPVAIQNKIQNKYSKVADPSWPNLDTLLDDISKIFVEWRYATMDGNSLNLKPQPWFYLAEILDKMLPED